MFHDLGGVPETLDEAVRRKDLLRLLPPAPGRDTKDASWAAAANRWWEAKRAELDEERKAAEPPPDATSQVVAGLLATHGFAHIGDLMLARDRGEAACRLLVLLREAGEQEGATSALESVLAGRPVLAEMPAEQVEQLDAMLGPTLGPAPAGRSLREHADRWIASLRDRVAARKMSPGRRNRYEQDIRRFLEWSGPGSRVDELTPAKMDGWYTHLCGIVEEGGSTETARHAIMTVRQLVTWLAERDTIPLPGNIRSRCHTFGQVTKENEHFSRDEIRAILQAADASSRRTKLYLLLMLNCGMYQADISDLRKDELDETTGTITRRRSKRRHQADAPKICSPL